jgi:peptide/nickel transport system permease protein
VGASPLRIMWLHISPQCIAPMLVMASASLGGAIFAEAALSFLGLGIPPGTPSWGNLLGRGALQTRRCYEVDESG